MLTYFLYNPHSNVEGKAPASDANNNVSESMSVADIAIQKLQSIYRQEFSFENLSIDPITEELIQFKYCFFLKNSTISERKRYCNKVQGLNQALSLS